MNRDMSLPAVKTLQSAIIQTAQFISQQWMHFVKKVLFFNAEMMTYEMPAVRSFDIDYPYQFEIAEILAKKIANNEL